MKINNLPGTARTQMAMEGAKDVWKQIPVSKADGAPNFSFRVFTILPGGHTPYHTHPFEHVNYIISGEGALVDERGGEQALKAGDFALVMPGEKHQYRNGSSGEPLVMICAVPKEYE